MIVCGLVAQALESYDRDAQVANIEAAEAQRAETLERFPRGAWPDMELERYALGHPDHPDSFCYWMEFGAKNLGSIKGGSARKHHIYWRKEDQEWWFQANRYESVEQAWNAVRAGFVEALERGAAGDWAGIDQIPALQSGQALLTKTLHTYFPDEILPICSHAHLKHFLGELGETKGGLDSLGTVTLNRMLLEGLRGCDEVAGWSTKEMERLLYSSEFSPRYESQGGGAIADVPEFLAKVFDRYGDTGIEARRGAEDEARSLLDSAAGAMDDASLRQLLKLFNVDSYQGKPSQARFSPAFVGATANGLAANLDKLNAWTERFWRGDDEAVRSAIAELFGDSKLLPFAGTSYPTMVLYLRDPARFAVWLQPTDTGLRRLRPDYVPQKSPGAGSLEDYEAFCAGATALMEDYEIPPELLDAVLSAASREPIEEEGEAGAGETKAWLFQANPKIFEIDRAVSEESQLTWVVRQSRKEIKAGDRAYIWRSGPEAGVIAVATVLTDPKDMPGDSDSPYLLESGSLDAIEPRVDLRIETALSAPIKRVDLLEHPVLKNLEVITFPNATNFKVSTEQDASLRALMAGTTSLAMPSIRAETAEELFLPATFLETAVEMLLEKGQVIFYGPPGTGKTWVAMKLAKELTRDGGGTDLVQFHPAYAYEDFVGGFRPLEGESSDGSLGYRRRNGPLREIAKHARDDPGNPYFLIVDEINRGNVPKVFGELLFLLEYRDRGTRLQYWPEEEFSLPKNLFVIGTMNTADRSIALVDAALRRRFYFLEFSPNKPPVDEVLEKWLAQHGKQTEPARILERLNDLIAEDDFAIGPSYFMNKDGKEPDLERIWERAIMPLLHEHYFGGGTKLERFELRALREPEPASEETAQESSD